MSDYLHIGINLDESIVHLRKIKLSSYKQRKLSCEMNLSSINILKMY